MKLYDEEELATKKIKQKNLKKTIIISIITLINLCIAIIALIVYRNYNPNKVTTYIDGQKIADFDKILDFQTDENGNTIIYVPIRDMAQFFGYQSFNGDYDNVSEEDDKCHIKKEEREVAIFEMNSKIIYKLDLVNGNTDYDYCYTNKSVFKNNGKLYTSVDGIEQGYNVSFSYDERKKVISIYTLDYLIAIYTASLENKQLDNYGIVEIDDNFQNWKAVFDNMLIVKTEQNKYGVISTSDYSFILEPKYDDIDYIQYSKDFLVENNGKKGIISKEGKTKVNAAYDELTLMDRNASLYRTKKDSLYGVIDDNENVIIYPENTAIGIDIKDYSKNGIKNGYILINELIPIQQEGKWAFYNTKGKKLTDFVYDKIGYNISNSNNIYSLLEIPDYNVIVVGQEGKYTFLDLAGKEIWSPLFNEIYMKISSGEKSYVMTLNKKDFDVIENLEKAGVTKTTNEQE